MIGAPSQNRGWLTASGLSLALHGAVVAALLWQPAGFSAPPEPPLGEIRLDILGPSLAEENPTEQVLISATDPETAPGRETPAAPAVDLLPLLIGGSDSGLTPPVLTNQAALSEAASFPTPDPEAPPPDPRIAELLDRIRQRLTEPCLLALPASLGEDQVQLSVMAADDRRIPLLMQELTQGIEAEIVEQPMLLDSRQCPALDFTRRDPGYPLSGVALQLEAQDIASGQNLSGRLNGTAGYHTTLLLIDDNGVVHDLRRYLVGSVAGSRFDIPIARDGRPRDTHQILIALATPARIPSVARHSGELAEDFFAAIAPEVGTHPRIGIAAVYVR